MYTTSTCLLLPFEASNTVMTTASVFHRAAVANHAFSCVCGGKEESWSIQNIRTHVHMFTRSQLLASHTLKQNVPSGGTLYYTDQLIILHMKKFSVQTDISVLEV